MSWAINIASAILLTTLTGTFLFEIWYAIGKLLNKFGYVSIVFRILKIELLFWVIPIAYGTLYQLNDSSWGGTLFRPTQKLLLICMLFLILWLCGATIAFIKMVKEVVALRKRCSLLPRIQGDTYAVFEQMCAKLQIPVEKVHLVCDSTFTLPAIGGLFEHYLILPDKEYTEDQLNIIFAHELTHYKQRNHVLRYFAILIFAIHFFNPVIWRMKRVIRVCGEYSCDVEAVKLVGGSAKKYFSVILELLTNELPQNQYLSALYQNQSELAGRIKMVQLHYKAAKKPKGLAAFAVLCMICSSTWIVYAGTVSFGDHYYSAYLKTVTLREDEKELYLDNIEMMRYEITGQQDLTTSMEVDDRNDWYELQTIAWAIDAQRVKIGSEFVANVGQRMYLTMKADSYRTHFCVGIVEPDATIRFIRINGGCKYYFELTQSGKYAVFIQNLDDRTIGIAGAYHIQ